MLSLFVNAIVNGSNIGRISSNHEWVNDNDNDNDDDLELQEAIERSINER